MAPVEGNTRCIYAATQSAKGTPATAPTLGFMLSGDAALNPNREIIQLPETDARSQRADNAVVGASPGGGWQGWWRDSQALFLAEMVQGDITGGVATPSRDMPYFTAWDIIPDVMCTQYDDCRLGSLTVAGQTLQGIQYTVGSVVALSAHLGATVPTLPALPTDLKFSYPLVKVTVGGTWLGTHDSFSITINRNVTYLRGDMGLEIFDSWPGVYEVTGQLVRIFEGDDDYRKFQGGDAAATDLTTDIFTEALEILLDDGTNSAAFNSDAIEYTAATVPVNVDGSPILQTMEFSTSPQATWADNLTITVA
jgi:hypothetical protein